jgi:hypothetical protein
MLPDSNPFSSKLLLFGAGAFADQAFHQFEETGSCMAFLDNNPAKWGTTLHGLRVLPPEKLHDLEWDQIVITSTATWPIYQQLLGMGVSEDRIVAPLVSAQNRERWRSLKNCHRGERAFIVGNGPSLRVEDLNRIHHEGEISFAFNKVFLVFGRSAFRPTYYVVDDNLVAQNNVAEIRQLHGFSKFIPDYLIPVLGDADSETYLFYYQFQDPSSFTPRFSDEFPLIHTGYTVTYTALQLAVLMGCDPIVLVGVDFSFSLPNTSTGAVFVHQGETNHFLDNYRQPGERWNIPYLDQTRRAYTEALRVAQLKNIRILNATRGGALEVFPRIDFDRLWD